MSIARHLRSLLSTRNERGEPTSDRFRMAARKAIRRITGEGDLPILDVGGREGYLFDPRISTLSGGVTVLDIEHDPLCDCRRAWNGPGSFVQGDLTKLPFRDGVFRTTVCIGTFYNLPHAGMVLDGIREMGRVTAPGGRILCEFRNAQNPFIRYASSHARKYDPSLGSLPLEPYTYESAVDIVKRAGLGIRKIYPVMPPLKPLALMFIVEAYPLPQKGDR